jgi:hydroxymethylpyrimidine pyrophosphatase-like HAD family hydrolase
MHWSSQGVCASERSPWVQRYEADCHDPVPVGDVRAVQHKPAEKIVWGAEPPLIAALAPQIQRRYQGRLNVIVGDDWFLEFSSPGATKAMAVAAVARSAGVEPEEVLAFGDGNNDVSMLEWAGLGVAMSHARPSARAAATMVAPDGDPETSFARAVEGVVQAALGRGAKARQRRARRGVTSGPDDVRFAAARLLCHMAP